MLFIDFLKWWYLSGWLLRLEMLEKHLKNTFDYFSFSTLLKTLFSPWRQNVTYARGDQALGDKFNALLDNLVSRLVGFTVRVFVSISALFVMVFVLILNSLYVILWPILPLSPAIIIVIGILG